MTEALIVARWLHFASAMVLFGGAIFPIYARSGMASRPVLAAAALAALLSWVVWLGAMVAGMTGDWTDIADPEVLRDALFDDRFGTVWLVRAGLILVVLALLAIRSPVRNAGGKAALGLISGLVLASLALTGHADAQRGPSGDWHRANQAIHLLAAGAWLGGLIPLQAFLAKVRAHAVPIAQAWLVLPRFSTFGAGAVLLILSTGLVNVAFLVGSPAALLATQYGRVLLVKVALFLAMAGFAVFNRLRLMPLIAAGGPAGASLAILRRNILAEQALGLLVLGAVAILGTLVPAVYR